MTQLDSFAKGKISHKKGIHILEKTHLLDLGLIVQAL
jgi:hypothetical protein